MIETTSKSLRDRILIGSNMIAFLLSKVGSPNREAIRAKISLNNRLQLYSNVQTMRVIKASFLGAVLPEFRGGQRMVLEVILFRESKSTFLYRFYEGGELWHPVDITGNYTVEVRSGTLTATATLRSNR